ncbi:type II toxin-antitoxin system RelE/ParE family toxin, partial [Mannheimia haemolytica]
MADPIEWSIITTDCFDEWFGQQDESTQERVLACLIYLRKFGYSLGRPYADTVYQSKFPNMKELRIQNKGKPIRAFYAFDPLRQAIVLCAGEKGKDK